MAASAVYGGRLGYQPHSLVRTKRTRVPLNTEQMQFLVGRDGRYRRHSSAHDPTMPPVAEWGQLKRDMPPKAGKTPQREMGEAIGEFIVEKAKKALSKKAGSVVIKRSLDAIMPSSSDSIIRAADVNFGARGLPATLALKQAIADEYEKRAVVNKGIGVKSLDKVVSEATKEGGKEAGKLVQEIVIGVYKAIAADKEAREAKVYLKPEKVLTDTLTAVTQAPSSATAQPEPPVAQPDVTPTAPGGSLVDGLVNFVKTPVGIVGTIAVAYLLLRKKEV